MAAISPPWSRPDVEQTSETNEPDRVQGEGRHRTLPDPGEFERQAHVSACRSASGRRVRDRRAIPGERLERRWIQPVGWGFSSAKGSRPSCVVVYWIARLQHRRRGRRQGLLDVGRRARGFRFIGMSSDKARILDHFIESGMEGEAVVVGGCLCTACASLAHGRAKAGLLRARTTRSRPSSCFC